MSRLTLNSINNIIKELTPDLTFNKGKGYFYFSSNKYNVPKSYYCMQLSQLTLDEIINDVKLWLIEKENY